VSDTERIYSLYVQANPVPDPDRLPLTQDEAELRLIERSQAMDTQQRPETQATQRPARSRTAAIAFAAVIVVGAVVGVAMLMTGDGDDLVTVAEAVPTITFDGETATYSGPETFEENLLTFRLENNSDSVRASFGWSLLNDETITMEDQIAWAGTHQGPNYAIPKWVEGYGAIDFAVSPNTVVEESVSVSFPNGKFQLWLHDYRTKIMYPAGQIYVNGG
jgi:hypothetical protein